MDILDKIIAHKIEEVASLKASTSESQLKDVAFFQRSCFSFKEKLSRHGSSGIIAEFKRKSPSRGDIAANAEVESITQAYASAGAAGLSILTDHEFFGGRNEDLIAARAVNLPILRKEFIIDLYQVTEAKAIGADAILLIAACLSASQVREFASYAKELGMEVLLELHDEQELDHVCSEVDMIGINNRNLKNFNVDIQRSINLGKLLPPEKIKIAESGIDNPGIVKAFKAAGYSGFLMGEYFMKQADPGMALHNFIEALKA